MEQLNYEVLKKTGYEGYILEKAPEKVMQLAKETSCAPLWTISSTLRTKKQDSTEKSCWCSRSPRG